MEIDPKNLTEEQKAAVRKIQKDVNAQIAYIAVNGCARIKCKNCYLKGVCDHVPAHSWKIAGKIIQMSKETKKENKDAD